MGKTDFNILIVEDEKEVAEIIAKYLEIYTPFSKIVIADSVLQATQKISNQEFDLIVTDIQLSGNRDAFEFIDRIRQNPKYYKVKFMVVSGCLTQEMTLRLMRYGIRNILVKPFTAKQILIQALSCMGIEKNPQKTVGELMETVKGKFLSESVHFKD